MTDHIKAFWYRGENNFGDMLTPWLINKITGLPVLYVDRDDPCEKYVVTGSILNNEIKNAIIWGAGLANITDNVPALHTIHAVRGPITANIVKEKTGYDVPSIGEPGILCGLYYGLSIPPHEKRQYPVGILPHYADYRYILENYTPPSGVKIIDITSGVDNVLKEIASCRAIITSSLHGIVAANSMETPFRWVKFSDNVLGDDTKFLDYFCSVSEKPEHIKYADLRAAENFQQSLDELITQPMNYITIRNSHIQNLLKSCPFKK